MRKKSLIKMLKNKTRPLVEGHRGVPNLCPENTMSALKKAIEVNADLIEIDVQLTKDEKVVVFHDYKVDTKTNGYGYLSEFKYNELRKLDAGSWFSEEFKEEFILSLEEVLYWAKNKIILSIELKHMQTKQNQYLLVKKVVNLIKYYQMEDQVQLISFNHSMLSLVRKFDKLIITSAICPCKIDNPVNYLKSIEAQVYNGPGYFIDKYIVEEIQKAGLYVNGGMVDEVSLWRKQRDMGVNIMCTNFPEVMARENLLIK